MGDLADIARLMSVPQKAVEQAADTLEQGIGQAANRLEEMAKLRPNITPVIARLLEMSDVLQTRRMACAIIANAMVFHQRIAGMHEGVKTLRLVCGGTVSESVVIGGGLRKGELPLELEVTKTNSRCVSHVHYEVCTGEGRVQPQAPWTVSEMWLPRLAQVGETQTPQDCGRESPGDNHSAL